MTSRKHPRMTPDERIPAEEARVTEAATPDSIARAVVKVWDDWNRATFTQYESPPGLPVLVDNIAGLLRAEQARTEGLAGAWTPIIQYIGELWAAATHDHETADPADVGMGGVPIKAWRNAYREGVKDMAEGIVSRLPKDQQETTIAAIRERATDELNKLRAALEQTDG